MLKPQQICSVIEYAEKQLEEQLVSWPLLRTRPVAGGIKEKRYH
jgi:hypothetical protein